MNNDIKKTQKFIIILDIMFIKIKYIKVNNKLIYELKELIKK